MIDRQIDRQTDTEVQNSQVKLKTLVQVSFRNTH